LGFASCFWISDLRIFISAENPSVVLADQVKSPDWRKKHARRRGAISAAELAEDVQKSGR